MRDGKIVAAVTGMDHGHINGMTEGIGEAGAVIKWAYDPDTEKTKTFLDHFQKFQVKEAKNLEQILDLPGSVPDFFTEGRSGNQGHGSRQGLLRG